MRIHLLRYPIHSESHWFEKITYFTTLSNITFLFPIFLTLYFGIYWETIILFLAMTISFLYHASGEKELSKTDLFFAYTIIISNFYMGYMTQFQGRYLWIGIGLIALGTLFYFKALRKEYHFNHSIWHIACALGVACLIIQYQLAGIL